MSGKTPPRARPPAPAAESSQTGEAAGCVGLPGLDAGDDLVAQIRLHPAPLQFFPKRLFCLYQFLCQLADDSDFAGEFFLQLTDLLVSGIRPMARSREGGCSLLEKRLLLLVEEGRADLLGDADLA